MIGKRSGVAALALGVVALLGLAACAPAGYDTVTEAVATSSLEETGNSATPSPAASVDPAPDGAAGTKAFVFESGVLELGDFDPATIGDNLFDPCTEITAEEFAQAGFRDLERPSDAISPFMFGHSFCFPEPTEADIRLGVTKVFTNNEVNRETLATAGLVSTELVIPEMPELYFLAIEETCMAQLDTVRGGVIAAASGDLRDTSLEEICAVAGQSMIDLWAAFGTAPGAH